MVHSRSTQVQKLHSEHYNDSFQNPSRSRSCKRQSRASWYRKTHPDEPAEALLERIRVEKQRLIKEGQNQKRTSTNPSFSDGIILIMKSVVQKRSASTRRYHLKLH